MWIFTISSIIIFGIISIFLIKRSIKLSKYAAESHANYIGKTLNSFTNIQSIKLFFASRLESIFNQKYINRYYIDNVRLQKNNMYIFISGGALLISLFSINIYILINQKIQNIITTGEAVMIITLVTTITVQCWNTAFYFTNLADYYGKISQAIQILQLNNIAKDNNNIKKLEITNGKIIFKNVSFNYNDTKSSQEIFDNLSITIESNQVVALIGKSGSGKSTFVNLLLKLYEIDKGQILIDDQDIYKCSNESFYENITLVPQNTILFNRTIKKNILYAKKDAAIEDVIRVSKMAEIHEFIMSLPDGYETIIDEGNTNISGGQRQRIAIARAFLKNSPIFIIDEGTSALDNTTEFNVYKSMENFMKNKTVLVITHDISILNKVDRVLFFSEGKIVADGQYNELINSNLEFRDFVNNKFDTTH
jgi:ATP-binding cassette subfamily B protein